MKFCDFYLGKRLIEKKVKYCKSFRSKLIGLMFVKSPGNGAFLLDTDGIHMNFVRFDLRIVWLDKNFKVVGDEIAKTWHLYYGPENAKHVLELPVTNKSKISVGDTLKIKIYEGNKKEK